MSDSEAHVHFVTIDNNLFSEPTARSFLELARIAEDAGFSDEYYMVVPALLYAEFCRRAIHPAIVPEYATRNRLYQLQKEYEHFIRVAPPMDSAVLEPHGDGSKHCADESFLRMVGRVIDKHWDALSIPQAGEKESIVTQVKSQIIDLLMGDHEEFAGTELPDGRKDLRRQLGNPLVAGAFFTFPEVHKLIKQECIEDPTQHWIYRENPNAATEPYRFNLADYSCRDFSRFLSSVREMNPEYPAFDYKFVSADVGAKRAIDAVNAASDVQIDTMNLTDFGRWMMKTANTLKEHISHTSDKTLQKSFEARLEAWEEELMHEETPHGRALIRETMKQSKVTEIK